LFFEACGVGRGTTQLAALWPGDLVVFDDVLAPPRLHTIIHELDFAHWWPTEIGWRQASKAFKRGVSLGRRSQSKSEVWFGAKSFAAAAARRLKRRAH
jgi:hypothetical protein